MSGPYYNIRDMDVPTRAMYEINGGSVLVVGVARPIDWATTVDIDLDAPADICADGRSLPFQDNQFDVVILDFVTNFVSEHDARKIIREANRVGRRVMGRCHVSRSGRRYTLPGPKQRFTHSAVPGGVEWIEIRWER